MIDLLKSHHFYLRKGDAPINQISLSNGLWYLIVGSDEVYFSSATPELEGVVFLAVDCTAKGIKIIDKQSEGLQSLSVPSPWLEDYQQHPPSLVSGDLKVAYRYDAFSDRLLAPVMNRIDPKKRVYRFDEARVPTLHNAAKKRTWLPVALGVSIVVLLASVAYDVYQVHLNNQLIASVRRDLGYTTEQGRTEALNALSAIQTNGEYEFRFLNSTLIEVKGAVARQFGLDKDRIALASGLDNDVELEMRGVLVREAAEEYVQEVLARIGITRYRFEEFVVEVSLQSATDARQAGNAFQKISSEIQQAFPMLQVRRVQNPVNFDHLRAQIAVVKLSDPRFVALNTGQKYFEGSLIAQNLRVHRIDSRGLTLMHSGESIEVPYFE